MAPVPNAQKKKLQLQCEWGSCTQVLSTMQRFTNHLMVHAEEFIAGTLSIEQCLADVDHSNTDEYQCQWVDCGYVTSEGSAALLRHLLFHGFHTRIKWQGTVERERCKVERCQLEPHSRNIIPEVPSSFVCSWDDCSFVTNNPDYFYCHVEMHSQMATKSCNLYSCQWTECQVKTKDKYKLRDHLRCHSQEKRYGCSQCGGLFSNRTKLFDHIHRQGILDEPNYQCSHCSKVFASERLLRDHMRHHVNHYKCPFCEMTCPAPSVLKKHIQWRHSSERPFACELCNHRAKTRTDIRKHMESHNADDAYQCDVEECSFCSKSLSALRAHFRRCHSDMEEKRYQCHVCQAVFSRGFRLTLHLKKQHNFKWPSGHVRFRYKEHGDGYLRLQTVRYESIELTQQILQLDSTAEAQALSALREESGGGSEAQAAALGAPAARLGAQGAGPGAQGCEGKGRPERSSDGAVTGRGRQDRQTARKKRALPERDSELVCRQQSPDTAPSHVTYLEDNAGHVIVVDCTDIIHPQPGADNSSKKVSEALSLSSHHSPTKDKQRAALGSKPSVGETRKRALASANDMDHQSMATGTDHRTKKPVSFESDEGRADSDRAGCESSQGRETDAHTTLPAPAHTTLPAPAHTTLPAPAVFPIEQLQGLVDDSADRDSGTEPSPKKARLDFLPSGSDGEMIMMVAGTTDDERMRTLYHRLEDDRMAVAVEAMTTLSRGLQHL